MMHSGSLLTSVDNSAFGKPRLLYFFCLLMSPADNLCKQFGPRSGHENDDFERRKNTGDKTCEKLSSMQKG